MILSCLHPQSSFLEYPQQMADEELKPLFLVMEFSLS